MAVGIYFHPLTDNSGDNVLNVLVQYLDADPVGNFPHSQSLVSSNDSVPVCGSSLLYSIVAGGCTCVYIIY